MTALALALEFSVTVRAEKKIGLGSLMTHGAGLFFFDVLEQRLFREFALVRFGHRLTWAEHKIEQQSWQVKHNDQHHRQNLDENIERAGADIAKRPDDQTDPHRQQIRAKEGGEELQDGAETTQVERHSHLLSQTPRHLAVL